MFVVWCKTESGWKPTKPLARELADKVAEVFCETGGEARIEPAFCVSVQDIIEG